MRGLLVGLMLVGSAALTGPRRKGGRDRILEGRDQSDESGREHLYVARRGGNIAASIGDDGIVIVDDQFAPLAEKIQASLKSLGITNKPVRFVINTHYHGDHTAVTRRSALRDRRDCTGQRAKEAGKRRDRGEWRFLTYGEQASGEGGAADHHVRA